jgi:hypothetical protein
MSLEDADILELTDRYNFIVNEYVQLAVKLAPLLEKFGKYKKELEALTVEFVRRGVTAENPKGLASLIQEELDKRGIGVDGQTQANIEIDK